MLDADTRRDKVRQDGGDGTRQDCTTIETRWGETRRVAASDTRSRRICWSRPVLWKQARVGLHWHAAAFNSFCDIGGHATHRSPEWRHCPVHVTCRLSQVSWGNRPQAERKLGLLLKLSWWVSAVRFRWQSICQLFVVDLITHVSNLPLLIRLMQYVYECIV